MQGIQNILEDRAFGKFSLETNLALLREEVQKGVNKELES